MISTGYRDRDSPRRLAIAAAMNSIGVAPCRAWSLLVWPVGSRPHPISPLDSYSRFVIEELVHR
jgi:hypothetical protein